MRVCRQDVGGVAVVRIVVIRVFVADVVVCVRGLVVLGVCGMCNCVFNS